MHNFACEIYKVFLTNFLLCTITCELLNLEFEIFALLQFNGIILKILVTVLFFVMSFVCYFFGTGCKKIDHSNVKLLLCM